MIIIKKNIFRSITPFLLRSQGRADGRSLVFNSRLSPSPMRTTGGRRRRRHKHLSAASPGSPLTPRNLTQEFASIGTTSSESDADMERKLTSTPLSSGKSTRLSSHKSARHSSHKSESNLTNSEHSKDKSSYVTNHEQSKSKYHNKSTDYTDNASNVVKKRTVETFEEYTKVVKSSQNVNTKTTRFRTPPRNDALLDVSK